MLECIARASKLYMKNVVLRAVHSMLNLNEVVDFVEKCEKMEKQVDIEACLCEGALVHDDRVGSYNREDKLKQMLEDFQVPILRVDSRVATMCAKLEGAERSAILQWISGIPYKANHHTACEGRTIGTGAWLVKHESYLSWRRSSASTILWLHDLLELVKRNSFPMSSMS